MAKYDLHGGGGAAQAAGEAIARQTLQQIKFEAGQSNSEPPEQPAEKTLPGYGPMPAERLRALAERQSAPGERVALIPPSSEKVAAASAALAEQTKQAEGALVKTLTGNGESKEAAIAKARVNQIPMMAMFAGRIHTEETGAALQKIDRIAKPAEVSVNALRTTSQDTPITWQGVKDAASFLGKCAKVGVGAYLGAGVVNMIGVGAALTVGKYYAMAVGVEAVYRTGQARWNKKPVKGSLPGTEWAAKKLNTFLDNPRKTIGEALMKVGLLTSEAEKVAHQKRKSRVAELATAAGKPEVVAQVQRLDVERDALVTTLDQGVRQTSSVEESIDKPNPLTSTMDLGVTPKAPLLDHLTKTLGVSEDVIRGKMAQAGNGVVESGTMYVDMEEDGEHMRDLGFVEIATSGIEKVYDILPTMKRDIEALDKEFPLNTDPDADKLSDHLNSIADEAASLRRSARSIIERKKLTVLDPNLIEDEKEFAARAGTSNYADFDAEDWALAKFEYLGQTNDDVDGALVGAKNKNGELVAKSERAKTMLKRLVKTIVVAQTEFWRKIDEKNKKENS